MYKKFQEQMKELETRQQEEEHKMMLEGLDAIQNTAEQHLIEEHTVLKDLLIFQQETSAKALENEIANMISNRKSEIELAKCNEIFHFFFFIF